MNDLDPHNIGRFKSGQRAYFETVTKHRFPWSQLTELERRVRVERKQAPNEWLKPNA